MRSFTAPWSKTLIIMSLLVIGVLLFAGGALWRAWSGTPSAMMLIAAAALGVSLLWALSEVVLGYRVTDRDVMIRRPAANRTISIEDIDSVEPEPGLFNDAIRTFGIGGFLSWSGWFRSMSKGSFRAHVTDPARSILITLTNGSKVAISPGDTEGFMECLRLARRQ